MRTIEVTEKHDPSAQLTVLEVIVDGRSMKMQWTDQGAAAMQEMHGISLANEIRRSMFVELTNVLTPEERAEALRQINELANKPE